MTVALAGREPLGASGTDGGLCWSGLGVEPTVAIQVETEQNNGIVVARLRGELDAANATSVGHRLIGLARRSAGLIVDLSELDYLDSPGVGMIFKIAEGERGRGRSLAIVAPPGSAARRVLQICSVDEIAEVHAAADLALGTFGAAEA